MQAVFWNPRISYFPEERNGEAKRLVSEGIFTEPPSVYRWRVAAPRATSAATKRMMMVNSF